MNHMEVKRDAEIRELAYQIWQEEGYPHGQEVQHWLKAEAILQEKHRPHSEPENSKPVRSKRTKGRKGSQTETTARP
jgi:hypothetical protein